MAINGVLQFQCIFECVASKTDILTVHYLSIGQAILQSLEPPEDEKPNKRSCSLFWSTRFNSGAWKNFPSTLSEISGDFIVNICRIVNCIFRHCLLTFCLELFSHAQNLNYKLVFILFCFRPSWPPLSLQKCPEGGSVGSCDSEQGSLFQDLPPNIPPQYLGIGPSLEIWPQILRPAT